MKETPTFAVTSTTRSRNSSVELPNLGINLVSCVLGIVEIASTILVFVFFVFFLSPSKFIGLEGPIYKLVRIQAKGSSTSTYTTSRSVGETSDLKSKLNPLLFCESCRVPVVPV